jgi:hypothetical protein
VPSMLALGLNTFCGFPVAATGAIAGSFPDWEADMKDFLICDLTII